MKIYFLMVVKENDSGFTLEADASHYLGIMDYISKYKLNELIKHQLEFISIKVTHRDPSIIYRE
jgi:hypothetical protein